MNGNYGNTGFGAVVILLALAGFAGNRYRRGRFFPASGSGFNLASLAGDFHRMVEVMNRVDNMGRAVMNPPKLPDPSQLLNTDALPDMKGLMDIISPFLNNFNEENIK